MYTHRYIYAPSHTNISGSPHKQGGLKSAAAAVVFYIFFDLSCISWHAGILQQQGCTGYMHSPLQVAAARERAHAHACTCGGACMHQIPVHVACGMNGSGLPMQYPAHGRTWRQRKHQMRDASATVMSTHHTHRCQCQGTGTGTGIATGEGTETGACTDTRTGTGTAAPQANACAPTLPASAISALLFTPPPAHSMFPLVLHIPCFR